MEQIGIIREIWRYPVKGMAGEALKEGRLVAGAGIEGDRLWALRDTARGEIQGCKFRPELLGCDARLRADGSGHVDVRFPEGDVMGSDDGDIHASLSALTGRSSTLEALRPLGDGSFYRRHKADDHTWFEELKATFARLPGEPLPDFSGAPPEFSEYVCQPGTFFLVTPFHLVTTATLARLRASSPAADWNVRRFRPNVVIETAPEAEGYVEQDWIGRKLHLGSVRVACTETTPRCGAVARKQRGLSEDASILRSIVREAEQNLGIYGRGLETGCLRVGDAVYLI